PVTIPITLCEGGFTLTWNSGGSFPTDVGVKIVNSFGQTIFTLGPGENQQGQIIYTGVVNCTTALCLAPTNLVSSAPITGGATLSWTPNGPTPLSWDIYAVPTGGAAPTAASTPTAN